MGAKPRAKPKHLPEKLLAIRKYLNASLSEMAMLLDFQLTSARISEYEHGKNEPNLMVLLAYARIANVSLEHIVDDQLDLTRFRRLLQSNREQGPHRMDLV